MAQTTTPPDEFWCPAAVQHYHDYIQRGLPQNAFVTFRRAYIRNISYALQYMEYISHQLANTRLHNVIENQLRKTFIITGCSVIESILWILLKGHNKQKQEWWEEIQCRETNNFRDASGEFKFEIRHYRKRPAPVDVEMRFIDMCRRAEKQKVLGISSQVYASIGHLRGLRNRVHIHAVQHDKDNDWWVIKEQDSSTMMDVLRAVLKADIFTPYPNYNTLFGWLDVAPSSNSVGELADQPLEQESALEQNEIEL